jgi:hypothetical protein
MQYCVKSLLRTNAIYRRQEQVDLLSSAIGKANDVSISKQHGNEPRVKENGIYVRRRKMKDHTSGEPDAVPPLQFEIFVQFQDVRLPHPVGDGQYFRHAARKRIQQYCLGYRVNEIDD